MLNKEYPNIVSRTQIIAGFPTETEEDFQMPMRLLDELRFDLIEVYKFSPRPGTDAALIDGQIPKKIEEARFRKLCFKALTHHLFSRAVKILKFYVNSLLNRTDWCPPVKAEH